MGRDEMRPHSEGQIALGLGSLLPTCNLLGSAAAKVPALPQWMRQLPIMRRLRFLCIWIHYEQGYSTVQ